MLIDSHAHLNFSDYAEHLDQIITNAKSAGVEKIVNIGTSLRDSQEAIDLAGKYDGLYATVGIHPNDNPEATTENIDWNEFEKLVKTPKVVAIGECGLDYSGLQSTGYSLQYKEKERQKKLFAKHIVIAGEQNLPLSIHIRDAQEEILQLFGAKLRLLKGVFHCFSGDQQYLLYIINSLPGFYISFAGNVTFPPKADQPQAGKNANMHLPDLAKLVPLERLLIETDCPFLAPEPLRGTQNEPANVKITAEYLAGLHGLTLDEFAKISTENTEKLFKI